MIEKSWEVKKSRMVLSNISVHGKMMKQIEERGRG